MHLADAPLEWLLEWDNERKIWEKYMEKRCL
jgi:hypothetical protein